MTFQCGPQCSETGHMSRSRKDRIGRSPSEVAADTQIVFNTESRQKCSSFTHSRITGRPECTIDYELEKLDHPEQLLDTKFMKKSSVRPVNNNWL